MARKNCKTPDCIRIPRVRGCCLPCYRALAKMNDDQGTTWEDHEKAGRCNAVKVNVLWRNGYYFKGRP